ncbi:hypothetical protein BUQ74_15415 [Leptospira weilii serovar Heyan]|nr:hypothetical protein BUQ74_15415 [Leptospira weilii serovar Heyan]
MVFCLFKNLGVCQRGAEVRKKLSASRLLQVHGIPFLLLGRMKIALKNKSNQGFQAFYIYSNILIF